MPAYGFFVRHVNGLDMKNIEVSYDKPDARPPFVIEQVKGAEFVDVEAKKEGGVPTFILREVENFRTHRVRGVADTEKAKIGEEKL